MASPADSQAIKVPVFKVFDGTLEYIILAKGRRCIYDRQDSSFSDTESLIAYKERYDRITVKNLLLDNHYLWIFITVLRSFILIQS